MTTVLARLLVSVALAAGLVAGCGNDGYSADGREVTLGRVTWESPSSTVGAGTDGEELTLEEILGEPAGAFRSTATVGAQVEFPRYLGLWSVDARGASIRFESICDRAWDGACSVHTDGQFLRVVVEGLEGVDDASADDPKVAVAATGDELLVVMGPGFDTSTDFTIELG